MLRCMFAFVSALMLTATFAATVMAEFHLAAGTTGDTAGTTVTAVPRAGVGLMADQAPDLLVLGLVGIACLLALLAMTMRNWQRA